MGMADNQLNHGCAKSGHSAQCLVSHTCNTKCYTTKIKFYIVLYVCNEFIYSKFCNMYCGLNEQKNGYLLCELMFS